MVKVGRCWRPAWVLTRLSCLSIHRQYALRAAVLCASAELNSSMYATPQPWLPQLLQ
jgi:hypothetical protein